MKMLVYALKDTVAGAASRPLFYESDSVAMRGFKLGVMNQESGNPLGQHPQDFILYRVGEFDDGTMQLVPCDPIKVMTGSEALAARTEELAEIERLRGSIAEIEGAS